MMEFIVERFLQFERKLSLILEVLDKGLVVDDQLINDL